MFYFSEYITEIEVRVNIDFSIGTIKNWKVTLGYLKEFLLRKYRRSHIAFKELYENFLKDLTLMPEEIGDVEQMLLSNIFNALEKL